jgi:hypothetical protein
MRDETPEELNFLINLTVAMILEFHHYEDRRGQIKQCPCPVLDGPGYVLYSFSYSNKCVQVSPRPATTVPDDPGSALYHKPLQNIRSELPLFLRWFWAERFNIDASWFGPDEREEYCNDEEWEAYLDEFEDFTAEQLIDHVMDQCLGPGDFYGIDCHFRTSYCPCAMVI